MASDETLISIASDDVLRDHLRLSVNAVKTIHEHAQVLAGVYFAAQIGQDSSTFISLKKIARVAMCSRRTVSRALGPKGSLVVAGYVRRVGRQRIHPNSQAKRRTVTYKVTKLARFALKQYLVLPRTLVRFAQTMGRTLTWSERVVLAFVVFRHQVIKSGAAADPIKEQLSYNSLSEIRKWTALSRDSVVAAKKGLQAIRIIVVDRVLGASDRICLNEALMIPRSCLEPSAIDELIRKRQSDGIRAPRSFRRSAIEQPGEL